MPPWQAASFGSQLCSRRIYRAAAERLTGPPGFRKHIDEAPGDGPPVDPTLSHRVDGQVLVDCARVSLSDDTELRDTADAAW